jgi:hypothetical protein
MTELHSALAGRVDDWRAAGYSHDSHPAIAELAAMQAFVGSPD